MGMRYYPEQLSFPLLDKHIAANAAISPTKIANVLGGSNLAADINTLSSGKLAVPGAWTTWTPTMGGGGAWLMYRASYLVMGKFAYITLTARCTTATTAALSISLPFSVADNNNQQIPCVVWNSATGSSPAFIDFPGATTMTVYVGAAVSTSAFSVNDNLMINGAVELA